jgi:hypothetical protein
LSDRIRLLNQDKIRQKIDTLEEETPELNQEKHEDEEDFKVIVEIDDMLKHGEKDVLKLLEKMKKVEYAIEMNSEVIQKGLEGADVRDLTDEDDLLKVAFLAHQMNVPVQSFWKTI